MLESSVDCKKLGPPWSKAKIDLILLFFFWSVHEFICYQKIMSQSSTVWRVCFWSIRMTLVALQQDTFYGDFSFAGNILRSSLVFSAAFFVHWWPSNFLRLFSASHFYASGLSCFDVICLDMLIPVSLMVRRVMLFLGLFFSHPREPATKSR